MRLAVLEHLLDAFIRKTADPDWRKIHSISDKAVPVVESLFARSIRLMKDAIVLSDLAEKYRTGSIPEVENSIPWLIFEAEFSKINEILYGLVVSGGEVAASGFSTQFLAKYGEVKKASPVLEMFSFNIRNPKAIKFANEKAAELVRGIGKETRTAIRTVISNAFSTGGHPYSTAKLIKDYIGLSDSQIQALLNYQTELKAQELSVPEINRLSAVYADELLTSRANMIARTETINAANAGQQIHWQDMENKGYLDNETMVKVWITTPDDGLCSECAALSGATAPIDGLFPGGIERPTLHPGCRCAMGLIDKPEVEDIPTNELNPELAQVWGLHMPSIPNQAVDDETLAKTWRMTLAESSKSRKIVEKYTEYVKDAELIRYSSMQTMDQVVFTHNQSRRRMADSLENIIDRGPSFSGELQRGMSVNADDLIKYSNIGAVIDTRGVTSWTSDPNVANMFTKGHYGANNRIVFKTSGVVNSTSIDIEGNNIGEVLVSKKVNFTVKNVSTVALDGEKVTYITVKEVLNGR